MTPPQSILTVALQFAAAVVGIAIAALIVFGVAVSTLGSST